MSKKIKALRSISGSYGHLVEGAECVVSDKLADELQAAGLVKVVEIDHVEPEVKAPKVSTVRVKGR